MRDDSDGPDAPGDFDAPVELPIDGTLDLHAFSPKDAGSVVDAYLDECRARGILHVRIVHGKGIGVLRETVHAALQRRDDVVRFALDAETGGSWGATLVELRREGPAQPR